nr:caleosin domain containing protein [Colletotrichum truncatum]KAF6789426.1 caleosin domain containing protein [Colletotrichum truncatum]
MVTLHHISPSALITMATKEQTYTTSQHPTDMLGEPVVYSIPEVPVTIQRKPFLQPEDDQKLAHTGTPRANIAATFEHPNGTTENDWAKKHRHQTVKTIKKIILETLVLKLTLSITGPTATLRLLRHRQRWCDMAHGHILGLSQIGIRNIPIPRRRFHYSQQLLVPHTVWLHTRPLFSYLHSEHPQGQTWQ